MKKLILIIFSLVFLSSNASSDSLYFFSKWLIKNNVKVEDINVDKIKFRRSWIPEENVKPNYETLVYELFRFIERQVQRNQKYEVDPSPNPYEFRSSLKEDKYIDKQLEKTALLSYLLFEDGQITIDKISPNDRFGKFINNETKLRSMSVGRSMASYTLAHAICDGYIDSFDTRLND